MVVGDDWQSIYSFTGSNLEIFTNFKKMFPNSKIIKLKNTYRNSKELIKITEKFINKNRKQIKKKLKSKKSIKHAINIYYYDQDIKEVLNKIIKENKNEKLIILGRNNKDINKIPEEHKNKYMTIHKSKGLESENTIIINLENKYDSLPSKITDSEFLKYVKSNIDNYPYAEERRLFYVALTRTKNKNFLIVKRDNPSVFIKELIKNNNIKIYNNIIEKNKMEKI